MAYIIKNTSGLINTRLTDVGRRNISQGNFNISYFQIGDSEVNYTAATNYNIVNNNILMPAFNAQNDTGSPRSNKQNIKYPYYVQGNGGNTYGIPFLDSQFQSVYNSAGSKGFFLTGSTPGEILVQVSSAYTITSNYVVDMTTLSGQTEIEITLYNPICSPTSGTPSVNDYITIFYEPFGSCNVFGTYPILTYRIQDINPPTGTTGTTSYMVTLDRSVPDYRNIAPEASRARALVYPSGMTQLYDTITPAPYWQTDTLNFESPCDVTNRENTLIWNMNIPWSVSPAGVFGITAETYSDYSSVTYLGTKEYLGYQEPSGQTFYVSSTKPAEVTDTFYYNSFDEQIVVTPKEQKAIGIIHYTNQDIDNVYGEKFATIPYDQQNPTDDTGLARHFKLTLPTLMWHKSTGGTIGETFYIDPPGYPNLCNPKYIKSTKNVDMNDPGIRYYQLWDTNPDSNGNLNRVGKVFPDSQIVVIDDEEIIAAMSYKANRNWTIPAPKLSLLTPNTCFSNGQNATGILTNDTQKMWVTYRLDSTGFTNSLHCNYYSVITGPSTGCTTDSQNVAVRFGSEFPFLSDGSFADGVLSGFSANSIKLICQIVTGDAQPSPTLWKEINVTNLISGSTINGYLTVSGITGTTFQITPDLYNNSGVTYNLSNYIDIPQNGEPEILNFGDEYYFYGNLETDITATIYEMKYLVNLGRNQFTNTSNPTWTSGTTSYVTEIGLYDDNKDLIVISKLQSPQLRQGIQQFVVKLDF
jgi:hypothetical protein